MFIDVVILIRGAYISASALVLITYLVPAFRSRLLDYGARSSKAEQAAAEKKKHAVKPDATALGGTLDSIAQITVPHTWFTSFYAVSVSLSMLWLVLLPLARPYLRESSLLDPDRTSTSFSRTKLAWFLMLCQGTRRLAECVLLSEPSSSTMWVGHWLVGLLFYVGMSVAIWVEGAPALLKHDFSIRDIEVALPDLRMTLCLMLFMFASGIQHDCHAYLASLKRKSTDSKTNKTNYQFPTFPAFNLSLTPHYLMECLIYLALAVLAGPDGQVANGTLTCALVFVVTNLGVTALGTRKWYAQKFGNDAVKGRWAMIPLVL